MHILGSALASKPEVTAKLAISVMMKPPSFTARCPKKPKATGALQSTRAKTTIILIIYRCYCSWCYMWFCSLGANSVLHATLLWCFECLTRASFLKRVAQNRFFCSILCLLSLFVLACHVGTSNCLFGGHLGTST